ncbi:MAG: RNA polymerase sigma factor SigZ [Candidatus Marinimicrobia bacterium]|nr:RNA polymerase sigma factor SigZ [Candidatus Neomarinimicrobiota bacterium]MCF7921281.1 RNA polymerase sigma factor SigZ [Candidatus Neomarinimicrobiota bacterium]
MKSTEEIWQAYHERLLNFLKTRVDHHIAEDLLQDVFIKIHSKIDGLKQSDKLESWVYQITRNSVIDYYRSNRPLEELPTWLKDDDIEEYESVAQELSNCLTPLIQQLPLKYRIALSRVELERKTQKELAEELGISISGAKSQVQRGRAQLKSLLHDCCVVEVNRHQQPVTFSQKTASCKLCC